ncbi:MAG: porin [Vicinamibacteraceae bacterium]
MRTLSRILPRTAPVVCLALGLIAAAASPAAAQDSTPPPVTIGRITFSGFVQADAIFAERTSVATGSGSDASEPPDSFSIPRARLGLAGALTSKITWYLVGDFANVTNDGRVLRDAYLQFTANPQFAVRFGQMVAPFSLERLTTYTKLELIDRSVIGASMVPSRDMGLMVFNVQPWRGWITYGAAIINGTGQNRADDNNAKDVVGRVASKVPRLAHLTVGVNAQAGEQPAGPRRRYGVDLNYEARAYRVAVERVAQHRDYTTTVDTAGFSVIGAYKHHARQATPHYAGYELAARYVDVDDDAEALTSHQLQAGGTYFVTPALRVQSNLVLPIGDDQPRHDVRWWSRLQFNF